MPLDLHPSILEEGHDDGDEAAPDPISDDALDDEVDVLTVKSHPTLTHPHPNLTHPDTPPSPP